MTTERKIQIHEDCLEVLSRIKGMEFDLRNNETLLSKAHLEDKQYRDDLTKLILLYKEKISGMKELYEIRMNRLTEKETNKL